MTVRDLQLDASGDLLVTSGDLVLVSDTVAIAQDISQRLKLFLGEDPVAPDDGTPWFQSILGKQPDIAVVRDVFVDRIDGTPGVAEVTSLDLAYDSANRKLTVAFTARTDAGELVTSNVAVTVP